MIDVTAKLPRPGYENITSTTAVPPNNEPNDNPNNVIKYSDEWWNRLGSDSND